MRPIVKGLGVAATSISFAVAHLSAIAACAYLLTISWLSALSLVSIGGLVAWRASLGGRPKLWVGCLGTWAALEGLAWATKTPTLALLGWLATALVSVVTLERMTKAKSEAIGDSMPHSRVELLMWLPLFAGGAAFLSAFVFYPLVLLASVFHARWMKDARRRAPPGEARWLLPRAWLRVSALGFSGLWAVAFVAGGAGSRAVRVAELGSAARGVPLRIAILGDSSPAGFFVPEPLALPGLLGRIVASSGRSVQVHDYAYPNANLEAVAEQAARAEQLSPDVYFVYVGVNHVAADRATGEPMRGELTRILRGMAPARALVATYPSGLVGPQRALLERKNQVIREVAGTGAAELVDLAAELPRRRVYRRYFLVDLVHPNARGHAAIAELVAKPLLETLSAKSPHG